MARRGGTGRGGTVGRSPTPRPTPRSAQPLTPHPAPPRAHSGVVAPVWQCVLCCPSTQMRASGRCSASGSAQQPPARLSPHGPA